MILNPKVIAELTRIATELEEAGLNKTAGQIDNITRSILKEAEGDDNPPTVNPAQTFTTSQTPGPLGPPTADAAKLKAAHAESEQLKKWLADNAAQNTGNDYKAKLARVQQLETFINYLDKKINTPAKPAVNPIVQKNKNVQKLLNDVLTTDGKQPISKMDGRVTPNEVALFKQYAPGYETKGWGYLQHSLEEAKNVAMKNKAPSDQNVAKTTTPNAGDQFASIPTPQAPTGTMPAPERAGGPVGPQ